MSSNGVSTIWVDLVKDEPDTLEVFAAEHPGLTESEIEADYQAMLSRFQPWRVAIKSGDNHEPLFRSTESYFNEADARHAAKIGFANRSNVFLRQAEHGDQVLRLAEPDGADG